MSKKDIAIKFLEMASSGKVREAYEKFVHPNFLHHNAYFKGDRKSLLNAMEEAHVQHPNKFLKVKHSLEDGDMVAVHSHVRQEDGTDIAVIHLFRFQHYQIVELWDVSLVVPLDSPNEKGVF